LFTHEQVIHIFGTIACIVYVVDRVRIAYPEAVMRRAPWVNRLFVRAEEQVRESAMIPYAIAVLLTILTVPKRAALVLAWGADAPALAIAGAAGTIALAAAGCELLPLRIDDNLTIPLFVGFTTWIVAALFALPLT